MSDDTNAPGSSDGEHLPFHAWAPTPPMGWNSWDCFATTVTEEQTRAHTDYMARHLVKHGWQYVVVDIQWYEPGSTGYAYRGDAELRLDDWGRLLPATNRFPSASGTRGFRDLADYVHAQGLKFGVHLMRGIPRLAVKKNLPIKGTAYHARDIADQVNVCTWNPDMFGVDMSKPAAQAYYDSVFELFAEWGVDYVKLDDMSRPYHRNEPEIEAVRRAIDRAVSAGGRPMLLSLSPGATALSAASHVKRHANLWRISDDLWDSWQSLVEQFSRLEKWNEHRAPGTWPDADMLPLGVLRQGQQICRLSADEQVTLMTLWSIARSPLMFGGDLTKLDAFTQGLLTNDEVLEVNQHSTNNRPLFDQEGLIVWVADVPNSRDRYLALFNARDRLPLIPEQANASCVIREDATGPAKLSADLLGAQRLILIADDGANNDQHPVAIWGDPCIVFEDGSRKSLADLEWREAMAWWGDMPRRITPADKALTIASRDFSRGFSAPTKALLEFELPPGALRFESECGFHPTAHLAEPASTLRFLAFAVPADAGAKESSVEIGVTAQQLGMDSPIRVRDLWRREDLGPFDERFARAIPWHGAGLFRVSPNE